MCLYTLALTYTTLFLCAFLILPGAWLTELAQNSPAKNVTLRDINLRITSRAIKSSVSSLYIYISLLVRVKHVSRMVAGEVTITFARALKTRKKEENNTRRDLSAVGERGGKGGRRKRRKRDKGVEKRTTSAGCDEKSEAGRAGENLKNATAKGISFSFCYTCHLFLPLLALFQRGEITRARTVAIQIPINQIG